MIHRLKDKRAWSLEIGHALKYKPFLVLGSSGNLSIVVALNIYLMSAGDGVTGNGKSLCGSLITGGSPYLTGKIVTGTISICKKRTGKGNGVAADGVREFSSGTSLGQRCGEAYGYNGLRRDMLIIGAV